jgi:hypothetical protein
MKGKQRPNKIAEAEPLLTFIDSLNLDTGHGPVRTWTS